MRNVLLRGRYVIACAVVLAVVVTVDAAPAKAADGNAQPRIGAAEREMGERTLPRIIRRIVKSFTDELVGPRP